MLEKLHVSLPPGWQVQESKKKVAQGPPRLAKTDFMYTKYYCEENVYLLTAKLLKAYPQGKSYACFISNSRKQVCECCQY